jgi:hypothetical protein
MFQELTPPIMHHTALDEHPRWLAPSSCRGPREHSSVTRLLNTTIACQVDKQEMQNIILTKQHDYMIKKDGLTKHMVKNLHKSTSKMFLFALAMDNKTVSLNLTKSCKHLIKSKTVTLYQQELYLQFEIC